MISFKRVKLTMQKLHYKVAPTWQKMYGGRQGMGCNSENKYLLASRQSLFNQEHEKKPKWRFTLCSWLVLLECTPWWSPASKCFCRVRVCVNVSGCGIVLLLLLCLLCLFHGFYQWISQPVFSVITSAQFMADMLWVVWFFKQKLHILKL